MGHSIWERETQRAKVYRAGWAAHRALEATHPTTGQQLTDMRSEALELWTGLGLDVATFPTIKDGAKNLKGCYADAGDLDGFFMPTGTTTIVMSRNKSMRTAMTLTHELAHAVQFQIPQYSAVHISGHGPEFVGAWMALLDMSSNPVHVELAKHLRAEFQKEGVSTCEDTYRYFVSLKGETTTTTKESDTMEYTAQDELNRRAVNREAKKAGRDKTPFPKDADQSLFQMSAQELRAAL